MARLVALIIVAAAWAEEPSTTLLDRLGSKDPSERVRAMEEAQRLPVEVRLRLAQGLDDAPPDVAVRIWRAIGPEAAQDPALVARALRSTGPDARGGWLSAARVLGVELFLALDPPLKADVLVELLCASASTDPASTALAEPGESRPEHPLLRPAPQGLDAALALTRHECHLVRAALAQWLGYISGADARRGIEALCQDDSALVRLLAIRALRPRIAERRDVREFLTPFVTDPSPSVRAEALRSLSQVASSATDLAAWVRLWDPDVEVRRVAAGYFVYRKLPWALPYLVRALASTPSIEATQMEQVILADQGTRAVVELGARLDVIPRAGMPVALRLLDGLSREAGLPGPCWIPVASDEPMPSVLPWPAEAHVTAIRVINVGPIRARVLVSTDGASWTDLGAFLLAQGEHVIPIGEGWRAARVMYDRIQVASLGKQGPPGTSSETQPSASCCPLAGPADAVQAWRAWADEARPLLRGPQEDLLENARWTRNRGRRVQATVDLRGLLREEPDHPVALLWMAEALVEGSAFDEAGPILERLVEARPRYAPALGLLARVREVKEDFGSARELLTRAIEADPAEVSYRVRRAALATQAGDHVIAGEHLGVAVRLRPEDHILRFDYGYALYSAGRYAEGLTEFRYVVTRDPGSLDARYNIACGLSRLGRSEEALTALSEAVMAGFRDADFARKDPDLESVRMDPRFEGVLQGAKDSPILNWK